jgi:putative transposase
MARAHRVFLPGHIWHITQRCHRQKFLLKARRDRRCWLAWLGEARRRYGLCVLNYIVTRNHVHLLIQDRGLGEISRSMQLVAGRTAQTYNERRSRLGAFWQDRYHATAVESDGHLVRCMTYIDLNMVRAGAVTHPSHWRESGYFEIQRLPQRYRIIDIGEVCRLLGLEAAETLQERLSGWAMHTMRDQPLRRQPAWTESVAVGGKQFLQRMKSGLGFRGLGREVIEGDGVSYLKEDAAGYVVAWDPQPQGLEETGRAATGV